MIKNYTEFVNENINNEIILYHGTPNEHEFNKVGHMFNGTFFSTNKNEAKTFGKYVYEVKLLHDLMLFDTNNIKDCEKLYTVFSELYDTYYDENDAEYIVDTPEKLYNMHDNWECIENTSGVLDWIESEYDGIWICEGGVRNLLLFSPIKEKLKSINLIS